MSRKTIFVLAGVAAAAGLGWWWWRRQHPGTAGAVTSAPSPVTIVGGGSTRTLTPGDPGYAAARALADAAERRANTGASHF